MKLEREAFKVAAAPALKQILDSRGVSFGYIDVRSDMSLEDLRSPVGVNAVLVGTLNYHVIALLDPQVLSTSNRKKNTIRHCT